MRNHRHLIVATLVLLTGVVGCQKASTDNKTKPAAGSGSAPTADRSPGPGSSGPAVMPPPAPPAPAKDIDSKDILARTETAPEVTVKHVLIGWKDL
ncbi:MAG TPA: hypothetical protein VH165_01080, partial [Kofleriaceae bacterium]|nr:hypothetical protein [Kofleriaceae bacterium]